MTLPSSRSKSSKTERRARKPSSLQLAWLCRGLTQPGGKLPLFDESGQRVNEAVIRSCRDAGWVEPWFDNPIKPTWKICRLTECGRAAVTKAQGECPHPQEDAS